MPTQTPAKSPPKDKSFKNLILDYVLAALRFLAPEECADLPADVKITPLRQEQLVGKLDWPFRETDVPLQVQFRDGRREVFVVIIEEETDPTRFDILRLVEYTTGCARLLKTERVVPVALFVGRGNPPASLALGTERHTFLRFDYVACRLAELRSEDYWETDNPFVCLNLIHMQHPRTQRLEVCKHAIDRFFALEPSQKRRGKYFRFVEVEARLTPRKRVQLRTWAATESRWRTTVRTIFDDLRDEGRIEGRDEGWVDGRADGIRRSVLAVLASRGLRPTVAQRSRILKCADTKTLDMWVKRAAKVQSVGEIFGRRKVH